MKRVRSLLKSMKRQKAIKELKDDGTLAKLSQQYFKEDVFSYVDKD